LSGRRLAIAAAGWLSFALSLSGCAARSTNRFIIRSGSGPIEVGHLRPPQAAADREAIKRAESDAIARRALERPAPLPSIEGLDPGLRQALLVLSHHRTAESQVAVAQNYWRLGVYDAAFDHFSYALVLDPKSVVAWDGRARIWRRWGMVEPALSDVHRAIFYGPDRAEAMNTLGTILESAGQCVEARAAYAGALKLDPSAEWAKANLARLTPINPSQVQ
jgi:tetratricopeptide (TPR) repeat protein